MRPFSYVTLGVIALTFGTHRTAEAGPFVLMKEVRLSGSLSHYLAIRDDGVIWRTERADEPKGPCGQWISCGQPTTSEAVVDVGMQTNGGDDVYALTDGGEVWRAEPGCGSPWQFLCRIPSPGPFISMVLDDAASEFFALSSAGGVWTMGAPGPNCGWSYCGMITGTVSIPDPTLPPSTWGGIKSRHTTEGGQQ